VNSQTIRTPVVTIAMAAAYKISSPAGMSESRSTTPGT
jgi:hypothetical protein